MSEPHIKIVPFTPVCQQGIDHMLAAIAEEYKEHFFAPGYKKIEELYLLPGRFYWVALAGKKVIGSVGIVIFEGFAVLKSLFLDKAHRGGETAERLLHVATDKARSEGISVIYLGTMGQFKAAQRFYEKHGFNRVVENELPGGYPLNSIDTIFYRKIL